MPASPDYSPFIPPLPSPYGDRRGVIPSPIPDEEHLPEEMPYRQRPQHAGRWPQHDGWPPSAGMSWGQPQQPPPPGFVPYGGTPRYGQRPSPMHPPHGMHGTSPWPGYHAQQGYGPPHPGRGVPYQGHPPHYPGHGPPPPPGHGPPYHSASYFPGPLPHGDPRGYGPSPYQPFHPMQGTPHSVPHGYGGWGTPMGMGPGLDQDPMGVPYSLPQRPDESFRIGKFEQGPNCAVIFHAVRKRVGPARTRKDGPTLTPFQVAVLDVKLLVNPLLGPGGDKPTSSQPFLIYNMAFPLGRARRSIDPPSRSWSAGRLAPATWPRVTKLNIISRQFPWVFEIHAARPDRGVTCLDLIDGLYEQLQTIVPRHHIEALKGAKGEAHKRRLYEAYYYNRSTAPDAPGGSLGEGVRKVDWLLNNVMYDGIVDDQTFVQEKLGIKGRGWNGLNPPEKADEKPDDKKEKIKERVQSWPATFVLKLDVRYGDSEADRASVASEASEASEATNATDETLTDVGAEVRD